MQLMERFDEDGLQIFATVARLIWLKRNFIVFGGEMTCPAVLVQHAQEQMEAWCQANRREPRREVIPQNLLIVKWTKPPLGFIKLNWDASIDKV